MTIRVVLADDHQIVRDGITCLLDCEPGIEVVASVGDGDAAVAAARRLEPDVVVTDIAMPVLNGIEATERITRHVPATRVICLSMYADHRMVARALGAGAIGYLLKGCSTAELIAAIRAVSSDRGYLSAEVTGPVIRDLIGQRNAGADIPNLTTRERCVLQLIAEGESSSEIAHRLTISVKTVSTHREHIMSKLCVRSVAGLTKYAIREGVTSLEF